MMHRWMDFAGGLLVGFGLATYVCLALMAYVLHEMLMMGVNVMRPFLMVSLLSFPAFAILLGVAVMTLRKRAA